MKLEKKHWVIIIGVIVALIIVHALVKAKLNQPESSSRSKYGWRVYNLIKHGQYTFKPMTPLVKTKDGIVIK